MEKESTTLKDQFAKKTKSGLTPEQEKMMGLGEHLSPEEKALAERNRAKMAERKKKQEEEGTVMGGIKKFFTDVVDYSSARKSGDAKEMDRIYKGF